MKYFYRRSSSYESVWKKSKTLTGIVTAKKPRRAARRQQKMPLLVLLLSPRYLHSRPTMRRVERRFMTGQRTQQRTGVEGNLTVKKSSSSSSLRRSQSATSSQGDSFSWRFHADARRDAVFAQRPATFSRCRHILG